MAETREISRRRRASELRYDAERRKEGGEEHPTIGHWCFGLGHSLQIHAQVAAGLVGLGLQLGQSGLGFIEIAGLDHPLDVVVHRHQGRRPAHICRTHDILVGQRMPHRWVDIQAAEWNP
ncbi:hypothetical protein B4Q13_20370 [Lacticaseibacillus rhamnosus]